MILCPLLFSNINDGFLYIYSIPSLSSFLPFLSAMFCYLAISTMLFYIIITFLPSQVFYFPSWFFTALDRQMYNKLSKNNLTKITINVRIKLNQLHPLSNIQFQPHPYNQASIIVSRRKFQSLLAIGMLILIKSNLIGITQYPMN